MRHLLHRIDQNHRQVAKAWVRFGSTAVIAGSYNITSVTRNNTGDFTVTLPVAVKTAMAVYSGGDNAAPGSGGVFRGGGAYAVALGTGGTTVSIGIYDAGGTAADPANSWLVIFGDF